MIPFFAAIPCLAYQRIKDTYDQLADAWKDLYGTVGESYVPKIADSDSAHCIIDSFISAAGDDFPIELEKIENLAIIPETVYDYTEQLLEGQNGTFYLTKGIEKPEDVDPFARKENKTFSSQMEEMRAEMWPLVKDYYESLSEEDKALVPDEEKLGIYIPTKKFRNVVRILADGILNGERDTQNVLLKGPPGVGKSTMAVAIAYVFSMPYRFTQSYKTADASEYIGTTVADNGVLKTNTNTQFASTVLRGGVHMDDDNNYAAEGEGTVKNSILIAPYTIKLADGTMAKRHPFSIFMMSANPDAKGSRPINEAYKDRFCAILDLEKLSKNDMIRMVRERSHFENEDIISRMIEAWEKINNDIAQTGETADMLSPRSLVNWAKQTRILGCDAVEAAEYNILGALCASEEYKSNVLNNEAYKDRFCAILDLEKLSKNDMIRMVRERSHFENEDIISRMIEAWEKINNDIAQTGETADMLSPRSLVNWAKQTRILGCDAVEAAEYNILGALCASEEYKSNVLNNIIRPLLGGRS